MNLILKLVISTISVLVAAYLIPGVEVEGFYVAFIVAVVMGVLNVFIKPVLLILTLPINILTLGFFTLVINIFLIILTDVLVQGFSVSTFLAALLFGLVVSLVSSLLNSIAN